ncbi:putative ribonuclease E/G family protein [Rhizobium phage RHph_TM16]|nr:putative ribonuclease E/G family protein [Rhizobium phage RHph_TM16]
MTTITLTATELQNAHTNIVSMVKRGANRIPFRFVKEDSEEMLDLNKIGQSAFAKAEVKKPGVLAVIVNKSADIEAVKTALKDSGLSLEKGEEGEDTIVFKQEGVKEFDVGFLKLDDNVLLGVSGLQKSFSSYNWSDTDFATIFSQQSFFPTLYQATEAFRDCVYNIMQKSEDKASISTLVSKAHSDFGQLVNTLVAAIPEAAVKADEALRASTAVAAPAVEAKKEEPKAEETPAEKTEETVEDTAKADAAADEATTEAVKEETTPEATEAVKSEGNTDDDLLSKLGALINTSIAKALEPVTAANEALKADLTALSTEVKKTDKVLKGTVIASTPTDRTVTTKKSEPAGAPPLLDTAFNRA